MHFNVFANCVYFVFFFNFMRSFLKTIFYMKKSSQQRLLLLLLLLLLLSLGCRKLHYIAPNCTKLHQSAPNRTKLHEAAPNCTKLQELHQSAPSCIKDFWLQQLVLRQWRYELWPWVGILIVKSGSKGMVCSD